MLTLLIILLILAGLWLLLVWPNPGRQARMAAWRGRSFAHRGL